MKVWCTWKAFPRQRGLRRRLRLRVSQLTGSSRRGQKGQKGAWSEGQIARLTSWGCKQSRAKLQEHANECKSEVKTKCANERSRRGGNKGRETGTECWEGTWTWHMGKTSKIMQIELKARWQCYGWCLIARPGKDSQGRTYRQREGESGGVSGRKGQGEWERWMHIFSVSW